MLIRQSRKIVSCICIVAMLVTPSIALADEVDAEDITRGKVTQLEQDQPAPFRGVLLSQDAAASLFGDLKFSKKECQLKLDKELKLNTANLTAQIEVFKLRLEIEEKRASSLLEIKNKRIEFLEKNWRPEPWYSSGEFWLATGVVAGILITVAAGHAVGQASK